MAAGIERIKTEHPVAWSETLEVPRSTTLYTPASPRRTLSQIATSDAAFLNVGLDSCSPTSVSVALLGVGAITWWTPDGCNAQNSRLTTAVLTPGVCTQVLAYIPGGPPQRQYRNLVIEYWRLNSITCDPPVQQITLRLVANTPTLPASTNNCPLITAATPDAPFEGFVDRTLNVGQCTTNNSVTDIQGVNPFVQSQVSFFTRASASGNQNQFDIEVYNNNLINGAYNAGCGTPASPHYIGVFTVTLNAPNAPLPPAQLDCQAYTFTAGNPPTPGVILSPFVISARAFNPTTFNTARPSTSPAPSAAPVAAAEPTTGIIIGSVGVGVGVLAIVALAFTCAQVRALRAMVEGARSAPAEWGSVQAVATKQPVGAAAVPNPLSVTTLPGTPL